MSDDRETWVPDDVWYTETDSHIVGGDGVYCPEEGENSPPHSPFTPTLRD